MSNSIAYKEKRRARAKMKAKENNMKRPKRMTVEERKLPKAGG